jgi:hypothetical protein
MDAARTPAQWFALVIGAILAVGGLIALLTGSTDFGTVAGGAGRNFIIWNVSGWETILYMLLGVSGMLAASRVGAARSFALVTGAIFAAMAIWGFIDGKDVVGIFAVDTTDNITYAVLGVVGLVLGLAPETVQHKAGAGLAQRGQGGHASHA